MWSKALLGLLLGRIATTLIGSTMSVSIGWHLYQATGNAFDLALIGLFQIIPVLTLSLFTGWVADNFSRRKILIGAAISQLAVLLAVAITMAQPELNKWYLYMALMVLGVGRAFFAPAIQSMLPNIVPTEHLNRAVALMSSAWNMALTIGPFVAGILLAALDVQLYWLLLALGVFTVSGFWMLPEVTVKSDRTFSLQDLLGGVVYLRQNNAVLGSMAIDLMIVLCGSVMAILPVFVSDVLHAGPETLGLLRAMPAIGATLVGLTITRRKKAIQRNGRLLFIALTIFASSIILFALSDTVLIACIALFIYGGSDMISVVIRSSVVQILTPDNLRGRVSALNSLFIASSNELGDFRAGSVTALIGPVAGALLGGIMAFGVVGMSAVWFKSLRNLKTISAQPQQSRPD